MKKIYIVFLFLFSVSLFAQQSPMVYDSLFVEDLAGGQKMLKFGLDPLATDGIDVLFGESDLPPFPPQGAFEARFYLPENNFQGTLGSYDDYRLMDSVPFTGTKEFRLAYQVGTGTVIKFTWNFPFNVTGLLQDLAGGAFVNVTMAGSGNYTHTLPGVFTTLKMLINYNQIIPVELVSFNASVLGSSVKLDWATATETNNSGFEVQRKSENSEWNKIGFVEGSGTTTERNEYTYTDQPVAGKYLYRLRQIDFDGSYSYSSIISADISTPVEFNLNQNYPNPFNPSTTVTFTIPKASNVKLNIYNQIGQQVGELVNKNLEAGSYNYSWNAANQSSGIYFYELQTNEFKSVRKMTLMK
ncbi:MAG: T9SS type A sorting domain-containing protein [Ignavibacteriaceae bacterium]|nr:T9SS type A sorting domain-containing protein [Ignavibacteriaceae bacterium]